MCANLSNTTTCNVKQVCDSNNYGKWQVPLGSWKINVTIMDATLCFCPFISLFCGHSWGFSWITLQPCIGGLADLEWKTWLHEFYQIGISLTKGRHQTRLWRCFWMFVFFAVTFEFFKCVSINWQTSTDSTSVLASDYSISVTSWGQGIMTQTSPVGFLLLRKNLQCLSIDFLN